MTEESRDPVWKLVNAYGGGLLVAVPGLILVVLGAPPWLTFTYLGLMVAVLGAIAIRRRSAD